MQKLRNLWNGLKALGTVIIIGGAFIAAPIIGVILSIIGIGFILFLLFLDHFSDEPEK